MLDVSEILRRNIQSKELDLQLDIESIQLTYDEVKFNTPIRFIGAIYNDGKTLNVIGKIQLSFDIQCYSCGEDFVFNKEIDFNEMFMQNASEENYQILSEMIDLEKAITDNIILKLPTRFLCKDDCKGICAICKKNKNYDKCNCNDLQIDPRFEKLKQLLK